MDVTEVNVRRGEQAPQVLKGRGWASIHPGKGEAGGFRSPSRARVLKYLGAARLRCPVTTHVPAGGSSDKEPEIRGPGQWGRLTSHTQKQTPPPPPTLGPRRLGWAVEDNVTMSEQREVTGVGISGGDGGGSLGGWEVGPRLRSV